jgi:hypothetical protein
MKKTFLSLFLVPIFWSCNHHQKKEWDEKCVVKNVNEHVRYGGLINEKSYTIKTGCGYTIVSKKHANVGDTIRVHIISYRAHKDAIK